MQTSSDGPRELDTERVDLLVDALVAAGEERRLAAGETLCREGEESEQAYVVLAGGTVDAHLDGYGGTMKVATHGLRSVVGEVTTLIGGRRTATLTASQPTSVAVVSRDDLRTVFDQHPEASSLVLHSARERTDRSRVAALLSHELRATDGSVVAAMADRVTWTSIAAGDTLFERGDVADAAYLVVSGRLGVVDLETADAPSRSMSSRAVEVGRGGIVGEFGLLEDRARGATVVALRDTTLARLSAADFAALTHDHTALAMGLVRRIIERSGTETAPAPTNRSFAIAVTARLAEDDRSILVRSMVNALTECGRTSHLTSATVDRMLRQDGIADTPHGGFGEVRLAELLHQTETDADHVILDVGAELGQEAPNWADRALHHADQLVVICSPEPDDEEAAMIRSLLHAAPPGIPRWLALRHPDSCARPSGAAVMRARFDIDEVHHVRATSTADLGRLARLAAGRGVGLVLSGGGARGHAHIGVFRALTELGITVDRVIGASMGSIVAGGIAQQLSPDDLLHDMQRGADNVLDYTIPLVSLVKGERIVGVLERQFGGWNVDDMWVPFSCVSTDLTTANVVVHRDGPAVRAIRTSVAIPGVLPPVAHDGHLLADGGVLDNLPAGEFGRDPSVGVIIASDVAPPLGPRAKGDHGLSVSGWKVARERLLPDPVRNAVRRVRGGDVPDQPDTEFPSLGSTLLRSLLIGSSRSRDEHLEARIIDLYLELDLRDIPLLDFGVVAPAAEIGYDQVGPQIETWLADRGGSAWGPTDAVSPAGHPPTATTTTDRTSSLEGKAG